MTPATQESYRKLAKHFYETRLAGKPPSPKRIVDALRAAAPDYRPAYWRRLRNALAFDQEERGYGDAATKINGTTNPVTKEGSGLEPKAKQRRVKSLDVKDERKLADYFNANKDAECWYAVAITKMTGVRPAELQSIYVKDGRVYISGAKKSHEGKRGADRVLVLPPEYLEVIEKGAKVLADANIGAIQDRIGAAGRRLWPQRKAVPSLYSWRHQLGSNLKASGLDRKEVAYIMGHQSTASVDRYGNKKTAGGGQVPRAPEGTNFDQVRELHSELPQPNQAAPDSPGLMEKLNSGDLQTGGGVDIDQVSKWNYDSGLDY